MAWVDTYRFRDCSWCGVKMIAMDKLAGPHAIKAAEGSQRYWTWLSCPKCAAMTSIETDRAGQIVRVVPENRADVDVDHLPVDVATNYRNAMTVQAAGVPSSAAVELRRTLEAAVKHKGVEKGTLVASIKDLLKNGLITQDFEAVLSHVRKIGNTGAHASDQVLTSDEVAQAMKFTTQFLRNLFEIPKELEMLQTQETSDAEAA